MTSTDRNRQAAGQPTGGQFAPTSGTDAGLDLSEQTAPKAAEPLTAVVIGQVDIEGHPDDGPQEPPLSEEADYDSDRARANMKPRRLTDSKGRLHCEDGPAEVTSVGVQRFYDHGLLHNTDGPAVIIPGVTVEHWVNGKKHRNGGPAVTHSNGGQEFWIAGKRHRRGGPAVTRPAYPGVTTEEFWEGGVLKAFRKGPNDPLRDASEYHDDDRLIGDAPDSYDARDYDPSAGDRQWEPQQD